MNGDARNHKVGHISRSEWRWLYKWAVFALFVVNLPYLLAALASNEQWVFTGSLLYRDDVNSYFAKMRTAREGHWLFHNRYATEKSDGVWIYGLYILLGQIAGLLELSEPVVFHIARTLCGMVLLLSVYVFVSHNLSDVLQRQTAFLLISFSAGLGWLFALTGGRGIMSSKPIDLWIPESVAFFTLFMSPHFMLGWSLLMAGFLFFRRVWVSGRIRDALLFAVMGLLLGQVYPFAVVNLYAVVGICFIWWTIRQRRIDGRRLVLTALASLLALLPLGYNVYTFYANPVLAAWQEANECWSPQLSAYLLGYGLLVPLAIVGVYVSWRRGKLRDPLPLVWLVVGWALLYLPYDKQRRFSIGLHIPMCLWAVIGLAQGLAPWARSRFPRLWSARRAGLSILLFVLSLTNIFLLAASVFASLVHQRPYFVHRDEMDALRWLDTHLVESDVVLSDYTMGNLIPAWSAGRVFFGHWAETTNIEEKNALLVRFFRSQTAEQERRHTVESYGITFLYYGSEERARGDYRPNRDPLWKEVFENERVSILQWMPDEGGSQ